ncbi:MAG TPA: hypothetical protein VL306_00010 [Methylomirabilota bacterium]|jgi:hypothetical protein|nr:hypothetical protein [Methylomirabilota bacterium]
MKNKALHSLGHAVLVLAYVSLVAFVMSHANQFFGQKDTAFTPVVVLMLFVLSAAITGSLVLGRPALMYMDGQKKEAIQFFSYTVGWLFVLTIVAFIVLAVSK